MPSNYSSKDLLRALRFKYPDQAILAEVTMEDEDKSALIRAVEVLNDPGLKKWYDKKGLAYDAVIPDGYIVKDVITTRRIDALMFDGQQRTAVEIKISRGDFFRDTPEKRAAWMKHTHRFVYLTPAGLIKPDEIPENCGLWEFDGSKIVVVKRAKINKNVEDMPFSMAKYFAWRAFSAEQKLGKHR